MTSCIQTHLSLFTAISMIIPKDRLLKLFKSLVSIQPKLLFSKNSYVRSSNTFNQLSILVDITYKLGNHLTTLLSSHDVSETRSLIPETSDFLVEMYLIYPSIAHQMDQLQDMFPLIPIKVIQVD